jgi:acyl carrier protein phosphodiesterase
MNYLAHAYLSFNHPEILIGNIISDFVKGKKRFDYPPEVQKGIILHRMIDSFTDAHPATHKAKEFFRKEYRLYSAAFVDVTYDHFLANDKGIFSESTLYDFSTRVYSTIEKHVQLLPPFFAGMFPYMKSQNWLYNYRLPEGIRHSYGGLVRRAAYMSESDTAFAIFNKHYDALKDCYLIFMPEMIQFASKELDDLLHQAG